MPGCTSRHSRLPTREGAHRRLTEAGFAMRPLVQFQRPVETVTGPDIAAFTVVRLERGAMAEGRIQILAHRTENTVWQPRWLTHRNGALGLIDLVVACADVAEAAAVSSGSPVTRRKPRRSGRRPSRSTAARCNLFSAEAFAAMFPEIAIPRLPFMGAYALRVQSLADGRSPAEAGAACAMRRLGAALVVPFPDELGAGAWLFVENAGDLPWRS